MTIEQALAILDQATQPQVVGKINREGYCQIQAALDVLRSAVKAAVVATTQNTAEQ